MMPGEQIISKIITRISYMLTEMEQMEKLTCQEGESWSTGNCTKKVKSGYSDEW